MTLEIVRTSIITKAGNIVVGVTVAGFETVDAAKHFLQQEFVDAVNKAMGQKSMKDVPLQ